MKIKYTYLVLLLFFQYISFAQNKVSGIVTDAAKGEALIGVSIIEKNTKKGTVTDVDGRFEMTCAANAALEFSYIGYTKIGRAHV